MGPMHRALPALAVLALLAAPARAADVVTVSAMEGTFTAEQQQKLREATALVNRVLGSPAFQARLAALTFTYTSDGGAAVHRQLLAKPVTLRFVGIEKWAVRFMGIRRVSAMIASTGEGSGEITFNTLRMKEFTAADYAGTIAHELSHIRGYSHRGNKPTARNLQSAPYRVGELVKELAAAGPVVAPATTPAAAPTTGLTGSLDAPAPAAGGSAPPVQGPPR